ncbi:TetR/AcrR family transcriptional regulator C-terminal domain-containing protein [Streptomyces sp. NBC_01264]|uniref:TetR/AcrR family transcriptional regulator C-terminal domain-containing protein n=1 Tax=Streptomyces sp. NBC_01264 TaxID=2903804 RepID=UPI002250196D|nr:TetR/AcrR family transcriptional regulator C-terminal domain-containing protein [Streptomyces sp. NBC_01264]MCX4782474.1 TetR/AcrR family transcriptional regulator C-terminal domain-containing protein [Streptomyces sp. NBC_01264]
MDNGKVIDTALKLIDEVGAQAPRAAEGRSWREAVTVGAEAFYDTLRKHPNALPLLVARVPVGPNGLVNRERVIGLLLGLGFPVDLAARAFTAIGHFVVGFAIQQHGPGAARPEDQPELLDGLERARQACGDQ